MYQYASQCSNMNRTTNIRPNTYTFAHSRTYLPRMLSQLISDMPEPIIHYLQNGLNSDTESNAIKCNESWKIESAEIVEEHESVADPVISTSELFEKFMSWTLFTSSADVKERMGDDIVNIINSVDDDSKVDRVTEALPDELTD